MSNKNPVTFGAAARALHADGRRSAQKIRLPVVRKHPTHAACLSLSCNHPAPAASRGRRSCGGAERCKRSIKLLLLLLSNKNLITFGTAGRAFHAAGRRSAQKNCRRLYESIPRMPPICHLVVTILCRRRLAADAAAAARSGAKESKSYLFGGTRICSIRKTISFPAGKRTTAS